MRITKERLIKFLQERPVLYQKVIAKRMDKKITQVNQAILKLEQEDDVKELFENYRKAIKQRRSDEQKERMRNR